MKIMRWLSTLPLRMRTLFLKRHLEQELDEELQYHLDRQMEQLVAQGLSPQEAHQAATRALGGVERQKERCRDVRAGQRLRAVAADGVFGWRQLRHGDARRRGKYDHHLGANHRDGRRNGDTWGDHGSRRPQLTPPIAAAHSAKCRRS